MLFSLEQGTVRGLCRSESDTPLPCYMQRGGIQQLAVLMAAFVFFVLAAAINRTG